MTNPTRDELFSRGKLRARRWCEANDTSMPDCIAIDGHLWRFGVCAYYRPTAIRICIDRCAPLGFAARAWSWPGYVIDRTPFGVVAHELGHHVDWHMSDERGAYFGNFSRKLRRAAGEEKLTNYCPNDAEWFAEIFRLFVTNGALLKLLRPRTYKLLTEEHQLRFVSNSDWRAELSGAPARTILQAEKKIERVAT